MKLLIAGKTHPDHSEITPSSGTSSDFGKRETIELVQKMFPDKDIKILDVGPGRGIYNTLLKEKGYRSIDAVEVYGPYIEKFDLEEIYTNVFHKNITDFKYDFYDIVIFGDVLEHLNVKNARKVISYAQKHSKLVIVSVPYRAFQIGCQLDGSGDHRQSDLTRDVFLKRYEGFNLLIDDQNTGVFHSSCINK